jgi:hypothetical protein
MYVHTHTYIHIIHIYTYYWDRISSYGRRYSQMTTASIWIYVYVCLHTQVRRGLRRQNEQGLGASELKEDIVVSVPVEV